ncbi:MAG: hypothetical protein LBB38_04290, partial [Puniceicoccales bacterium]|nr:hypothetical protein [Puniceicoccales bacterium]
MDTTTIIPYAPSSLAVQIVSWPGANLPSLESDVTPDVTPEECKFREFYATFRKTLAPGEQFTKVIFLTICPKGHVHMLFPYLFLGMGYSLFSALLNGDSKIQCASSGKTIKIDLVNEFDERATSLNEVLHEI